MHYDPDTKYGKPGCAVGAVFHTLMRDKGMTRADLTRLLVEEDGQVTKWCKGTRTPDADQIEAWRSIPRVAPYVDRLATARGEDRAARAAELEAAKSRRAKSRPAEALIDEEFLLEAARRAKASAAKTRLGAEALLLVLDAVSRRPGALESLEATARLALGLPPRSAEEGP